MGIVSGITENRLSDIRGYVLTNPYQVGVNGVSRVERDNNGDFTLVEYTIGDVFYRTVFDDVLTTTFEYNSTDCETQHLPVIKDEIKLGVVFKPKVNNELFIERGFTPVFERHSRLRDVGSLRALGDYRDGYYNIRKDL